MKDKPSSKDYVPAIDGMRAVAVLGVLIYHVKLRGFSGGFVGVDIFFVISGYLISRIIFTEVDRNDFSFARFYQRRIRRIIPAMFAVLAVTALFFLMIFSPFEFIAFEKSLQAAIFSISNFYFYSTVDYFNNSSDIPLLHTWSLGVEEQFYFIFPAMVVFAAKVFPRQRVPLLVIFAVASFISSVYLTNVNQPAAFYFPTSRWWELMVGSLLAAVNLSGTFWDRPKMYLSWVGAVGVMLSLIALNDKMPFPGFLALLPVASSAALIAGAEIPTLPNSVLTSAAARWFGKISYSLYLIHWPVISLLWCFTAVGNRKAAVLAVVLSVVLAWLSWKYVEAPFRKKSATSSMKMFLVFAAACISMLVVAKVEAIGMQSFWDRYPQAEQFQSRLGGLRKIKTDMSSGSCFLTKKINDISMFDEAKCLSLSESKRNVLLIGDSHAADLILAFREVFPQINFLQASASGCPPIIDASGAERCRKLMNYIFKEWAPNHGAVLDAVILSAKWQSEDVSGVAKSIEWLSAHSIKPIVIGPSPEFTVPLPRLLAYSVAFKSPELVQKFVVKERFTLDRKFMSDPDISSHYISLMSALCNVKQANGCTVTPGGTPLYFDRDHFTEEGAAFTLNLLSPEVLRFL